MGRPLGKSAGGKYCSAVGCQNCQNRDGKRGVKFYRFPKNEERCKKWIIKVNRLENGTLWNPRKHSRLCSEHFIGGAKNDDPSSLSYLPSLFSHTSGPNHADMARSERRQRREHDRKNALVECRRLDLREQLATEHELTENLATEDGEHNFDEQEIVSIADCDGWNGLEEETEKVLDSDVVENDTVMFNEDLIIDIELESPNFSYGKKVTIHQKTQTPAWIDKPMEVKGQSKYEFNGFFANEKLPATEKDPEVTFECHCVTSTEKGTAIITLGKVKKFKTTATLVKPTTKEASTNIRLKYLPILELQDTQFSGHTGITKQVFNLFLYRIGSDLEDSRSITREYKLILVLVKLKLDVTFQVLASMFNVSAKHAKNWFDTAFWALHSAIKDLVIWLSKPTIQARMPASFREHFPSTRAIIDASEVECSRAFYSKRESSNVLTIQVSMDLQISS